MKRVTISAMMLVLVSSLAGLPVYAQKCCPAASSDYSMEYTSDYVSPYAEHYNYDIEPPGELILADVLILRPLGIAASVVGLAGSIVSIPFAASSCSQEIVAKKLIKEPFAYTWRRPLGDMDY